MIDNKILRQQLGGIVFFQTKMQAELSKFYTEKVGCKLWMDRGGCHIFQHGNMLFGLCQREVADDLGMITFFYSSREEVDEMYEKCKDLALEKPKENDYYGIYHFYAKDLEGRNIEFQHFLEE
jgi:hypothetical protein